MRIEAVSISNIKGLRQLDTQGIGDATLIVLGGKNGAGKSSALDAIEAALHGLSSAPAEPITHGQRRGDVVLTLTNGYRIERRFRASGSTLHVIPPGEDEAPIRAPQSQLDKWLAGISFDPISFTRKTPKQQRDLLAALVKLDFVSLDQTREGLYDSRTTVNRERHRQEGVISEKERSADLPEKLIGTEALLKRQRDAEAAHADHAALRSESERSEYNVNLLTTKLEEARAEVARLEGEVGKHVAQRDQAQLAFAHADENLPDLEVIRQAINIAHATNDAIRERNEYDSLAASIDSLKSDSDSLTQQIEGIDRTKQEMTAAASFPVEGLSIDEDCVLWRQTPLGDASSAEQLRVSTAVACAMNPELKVVLIRDGSLLDDDSLQGVVDTATAAGAQVWVERVGTDAHTTIEIVEGVAHEVTQ